MAAPRPLRFILQLQPFKTNLQFARREVCPDRRLVPASEIFVLFVSFVAPFLRDPDEAQPQGTQMAQSKKTKLRKTRKTKPRNSTVFAERHNCDHWPRGGLGSKNKNAEAAEIAEKTSVSALPLNLRVTQSRKDSRGAPNRACIRLDSFAALRDASR